MKCLHTLIFWAGLSVLASTVNAEAELLPQYQSCVACHGAAGEGNADLNAPALAGQGAAYLQRQLEYFNTGVRGADPADVTGSQMAAMASVLSEADMLQLATYLSELTPPVPVPAADADLKNGNNYYHSKCGACHGGRAEGNPGLNAPALASLDTAYLKRQFQNFQQGVRGTHPQDTYGRQMKMMSTSLPTDKDLDDVIAFMQSMAGSQ